MSRVYVNVENMLVYEIFPTKNEALNLLKFLSNTAWGADRSSLIKIYRAVVRSKIDYALPMGQLDLSF